MVFEYSFAYVNEVVLLMNFHTQRLASYAVNVQELILFKVNFHCSIFKFLCFDITAFSHSVSLKPLLYLHVMIYFNSEVVCFLIETKQCITRELSSGLKMMYWEVNIGGEIANFLLPVNFSTFQDQKS